MILFLAPRCPEGCSYFCFFYLPNRKYNPKAFLYGWILITWSSYTTFTHFFYCPTFINFETLASPPLHPQCARPEYLQPRNKICTCLGHLSACPRVLLFHVSISTEVNFSYLKKKKKIELYFINSVILQPTRFVTKTRKQICYSELGFIFQKILWMLLSFEKTAFHCLLVLVLHFSTRNNHDVTSLGKSLAS